LDAGDDRGLAPGDGSLDCVPMHDVGEITPDLCAALVTPHIERLTFAVVHASIGRAGPRMMGYGVPVGAIDIVGQLRMGLAVLRYHRADAHAAAWQAAGHTVDTIRKLADGAEREIIEAETNRVSGRPYATLSAAERARLVSGLTDLPGQP
jgi:hypothetical protein